MASGWDMTLDPAQRSAVEHETGPLLVIAGAGTGKTKTLVARLAKLIQRGEAPERLLLVTFSRRAAQELIRRLGALAGNDTARRVPAGTFHSIAHRILRIHAASFGLGEGFSVIDRGDAADLMGLARASEGVGRTGDSRRFPRKETLVSCYSRVVNSGCSLRQILEEHYPWVGEHEEAIAGVFDIYTRRKREGSLLDFDDLLLYWRQALSDPRSGPLLGATFDHVLVDEYQDTNLVQTDIVAGLHRYGVQVTAVGDDAQCIYGFRSARMANMADFSDRFPGASIVALEQNFRSTQPILDLANAVLADSAECYPKRLWSRVKTGSLPVLATCLDEGVQAEAVADEIIEHFDRGVSLHEQAVLFRSAHHSDLLELELRRRRIPFVKYGGLRFLESAHVRDLLAAFRVLDNPGDELAWFRLLLLLDGVGPATARKWTGELRMSSGEPHNAYVRLRDLAPPLPRRAAADAALLGKALLESTSEAWDLGTSLDTLRLGLDPLIRRRYDNADERLHDFDALGRLASTCASRADFAAELTLDPPSSTADLAGPPTRDDDFVILSTVHSAKGGEWRVVHLIHAADGMFPSDMSTGNQADIEEERRLFYVALTRAKEHLHIYAPFRLHTGHPSAFSDKHGYAQRTRFLPDHVRHLLDERAVRSRHGDLAACDLDSMSLRDMVEGTLRALW
jgi:DNA helicase-2/ATP-dependent DNA helicase PcrA